MASRIVKRAVLDEDIAGYVSELIQKLRRSGAKTDTSKTVNAIIRAFIAKASERDFKALQREFFDKKGYLKEIIQNASQKELDAIVKKYLNKTERIEPNG